MTDRRLRGRICYDAHVAVTRTARVERFPVSDAASYVTGAIVPMDGGSNPAI